MQTTDFTEIINLLSQHSRIVVLQADNPDADSLGSALALEHILSDLKKDVALYCGVRIPDYLKYLPGWDRVIDSMPSSFDLTIFVDASTYLLFEHLEQSGQMNWVRSKSSIVLDHHRSVDKPLDFTDYQIIKPDAASTGELIYELANSAGWQISADAAEYLMASILGDTQGLTNDLATAETYRTMASLIDLGADRVMLEERRREQGKMIQKIYRYKAHLIEKTQFAADGMIAYLNIPQDEINEYSPHYNPAPLIQSDMLQVENVAVTLVFKTYDDGRITAAIRANAGYPFAAKIAEHMGGGGHTYAAGFKITDGSSYGDVRSKCLEYTESLLKTLK